MPINEIESHPFLELGEAIPTSRMIVGTFPIYSLTKPETEHKIQLQQRGDLSFFYGSKRNKLWSWYKEYVDKAVEIESPQSILSSLQNKGIAISDVIMECSRINESFEDSKLKNVQWNLNLCAIIESRIDKIICTSKSTLGAMGWLRDKILMPEGFTVNQHRSIHLHQYILNTIPDHNSTVRLVAQVLQKGRRSIQIVAIPSPGSPNRRLIDFGYIKGVHTTSVFLNSYLRHAFNWFLL